MFLEIQTEYDSVPRSNLIRIMALHGFPKRILHILRSYWRNLEIMLLVNGKISSSFRTQRGIIQGDHLSPMLFNILVDFLVQNLMMTFLDIDRTLNIYEENILDFYEDDGMIEGTEKRNLEDRLDKINDILNNLGLFINHNKTEWMTTYPL